MSENELLKFSKIFKTRLESLAIWPEVQLIFNICDNMNRKCWISGGAVRDLLLGLEPHDIDLTTDATESEILTAFPESVLVGRQFGVYKIPRKNGIIDLTVFREEHDYQDGRRPDQVYVSTPDKDACRRDFTINALFWDIKNEMVVDYVEGLKDLQGRVLRCVGEASTRFKEDHLRILRLVRFAHQLKFNVSPTERAEAMNLAHLTTTVSGERLSAEICKVSSDQSRWDMYKDPLFIEVMKHNNLSLQFDGKKLVSQILPDVALEKRIFFEVLYLIGMNTSNLQKLLLRFKFSTDVRKFLEKQIEIYQLLLENKDFVVYCLLIDKSNDYLLILKSFLQLDLISTDLMRQILDSRHDFPAPLVQAQHVLDRVPPRLISQVLQELRAWQIRYKVGDQQLCLDHLSEILKSTK